MQHIEAIHAFKTRNDVRGRVALWVSYVQPRSGRVREHVEYIVLRLSEVCVGDAKGIVVIPELLPFRLYSRGAVFLVHASCRGSRIRDRGEYSRAGEEIWRGRINHLPSDYNLRRVPHTCIYQGL